MTRREFFKDVKTWKGAELRCAVIGNKRAVSYREFTRNVMINAQTMFVKSALMATRHNRSITVEL
jgi:hypothetical protein